MGSCFECLPPASLYPTPPPPRSYDYYLVTSAAYASTRKACAPPLHALYSYDDASVWVVNSRGAPAPAAGATVLVEAFSPTGAALYNRSLAVPGVAADGAAAVGGGPPPAAMLATLGQGRVYFVRLRLLDASGGALEPPNTYALSTSPDVLEWDKSSWFDTPCSSYADLTDLRSLPRVDLASTATPLSSNVTRVHLALPSDAPSVAFFARARLVDATGADVPSVRASDNFVTLRPGESADIDLAYDGAAVGPATVVVDVFNNVAGAGSVPAAADA